MPQLLKDSRCLPGLRHRIGRDADIQGSTAPDGKVEGAHCFLERGLWVRPVRIEKVDVIEAHSVQALIEACDQVFP